MAHPSLNPNVLLSPVENGYVAYDPVSDHLHELNPVAAFIAELCDGRREIAAIREIAAPFVPEGHEAEVERWIESAVGAGLLVWNDGDRPATRLMSAEDLSRLAARLRSHGKVQTAFLCLSRVVELTPDDPEAWCALAEVAHIVGHREEARHAYEKYFAAHPEDAEVEHILTALRDEPPPARVPDACIRHLYRNFSSFYENNMVDALDYQGPERIAELARAVLGERGGLDILELGCGTGLCGIHLKPRASRLVGIDLSPEMVELARARGLYDRLEVAEITDWLARDTERFDLVVACDTLIYFGDLAPVIASAVSRLNPNGFVLFSVERGERKPFHLMDSGRYAHHRDHLAEVASGAGLSLVRLEEGFLRMEYGNEVTALVAAMTRP